MRLCSTVIKTRYRCESYTYNPRPAPPGARPRAPAQNTPYTGPTGAIWIKRKITERTDKGYGIKENQ